MCHHSILGIIQQFKMSLGHFRDTKHKVIAFPVQFWEAAFQIFLGHQTVPEAARLTHSAKIELQGSLFQTFTQIV